jgi:hypothetical protein
MVASGMCQKSRSGFFVFCFAVSVGSSWQAPGNARPWPHVSFSGIAKEFQGNVGHPCLNAFCRLVLKDLGIAPCSENLLTPLLQFLRRGRGLCGVLLGFWGQMSFTLEAMKRFEFCCFLFHVASFD